MTLPGSTPKPNTRELPLTRSERLRVEHEALRELVYSSPSLYQLDHVDTETGEATVTLKFHERSNVNISVRYPHGFPGERPLLITNDAEVKTFRHVNRFGSICTLRYEPDDWQPDLFTAARLLPDAWKLIMARGELDELDDDEAREPLDFNVASTTPMVLVHETITGQALNGEHGGITLLTDGSRNRLYVEQVFAANRVILWESERPETLYGPLPTTKESAFWFKPTATLPYKIDSVDDLLSLMSPATRKAARLTLPHFGRDKNGHFVFLIPFVDETGERWMTIQVKQHRRHKGPYTSTVHYLNTLLVGHEAYFGRLNGLIDHPRLSQAHCLVIGAGALGSEAIFQLHRCGLGRFTVVDKERIAPGNPVRSEYGVHALGALKVQQLEARLHHHLPVRDFLAIPGDILDPAVLTKLQERHAQHPFTSILVAVGHHSLSRMIDRTLADYGVAVTYTWTTRGAAGGVVLTSRTGSGTYNDYHRAEHADVIPDLPSDDLPNHLERGCASPALPAAPLDTREMANQAARTILDQEQGHSVPFLQMWTRSPHGRFPGLAWLKIPFDEVRETTERRPVDQSAVVQSVQLTYTASREIEKSMRDRSHLETGGLLLGLVVGARIQIELVSNPGPSALRTSRSFAMDHSYAQGYLDALHKVRPDLQFLGEWHSHPVGGLAPSATDRRAALRLANAPGTLIDVPVLLIGQLRGGELVAEAHVLQPSGDLTEVPITILPLKSPPDDD